MTFSSSVSGRVRPQGSLSHFIIVFGGPKLFLRRVRIVCVWRIRCKNQYEMVRIACRCSYFLINQLFHDFSFVSANARCIGFYNTFASFHQIIALSVLLHRCPDRRFASVICSFQHFPLSLVLCYALPSSLWIIPFPCSPSYCGRATWLSLAWVAMWRPLYLGGTCFALGSSGCAKGGCQCLHFYLCCAGVIFFYFMSICLYSCSVTPV